MVGDMSYTPAGNAAPKSEAVSGVAGSTSPYARSDHQHPRLTSTTVGTIGAGGTATIAFTRTFTAEPGVAIFEIGGATGALAQPAMFKVESWVMTGADFTGCVVRAWRAQTVPQNLVTLLLSAIFNIFGATAASTNFSIIAVQRSDV